MKNFANTICLILTIFTICSKATYSQNCSAGSLGAVIFNCNQNSVLVLSSDIMIDDGSSIVYVLHDGTDISIGSNVYATSTDGVFTHDGSIPTNVSLCISTVVGNNLDANGIPLSNGSCYDISNCHETVFLDPIEIIASEVCDPATGTYSVDVMITGGGPEFFPGHTYELEGDISGTLNMGSSGSFGPFNSGESYSFQVIEDGKGCSTNVYSGSTTCEVIADCNAGTLGNGAAYVCNGGFVIINATGIDIEDSSTQTYVLHDGSSSTIGDIYATAIDGVFVNDGNIQTNVTFCISSVVGNNLNSNGVPSPNASCYDISNCFQVVFLDPIEITAVEECDESTGTYTVQLTINGGGPAFFPGHTYTLAGDFTGDVDAGSVTTYGPFDSNTSYSFSVIEDGKGCSTDFYTGSANCDVVGISTNVWPGDINNDGIVNNQDDAIYYLYYNYNNNNIPRQEQGIDWEAYSCPDWGFAVPEAYGNDIKHFDCDGNGSINLADKNAILLNWGNMHNEANFNPFNGIYPFGIFTSNTKIYLQPIGNANDDVLTMNIVLENTEGLDLELFGGFFTILYPATIVSEPEIVFNNSWLGNPNNNLNMDYKNFPQQQKLEVSFSRTDGLNALGSGVIGQIAFSLSNTNVRLSKKAEILDFEIINIGAHNNLGSPIGIPNQPLSVNVGSVICEPSVTITKATPFQNIHKSSGNLQTSGSLIIGQNQQVEYWANRVRLNNGFSARAGADFRAAYSNNCNTSLHCDPLFEDYPPLVNYLNPTSCTNEAVEEYFDGNRYYFIYIRRENEGDVYLYYNDIFNYYGNDMGDGSSPAQYGMPTGRIWECGC